MSAPFQNPDFLAPTRLTWTTVLQVHTYVVFTQQLHIEESRTILPFAFLDVRSLSLLQSENQHHAPNDAAFDQY